MRKRTLFPIIHIRAICFGILIATPALVNGQANPIPGDPVVVKGSLGIKINNPWAPLTIGGDQPLGFHVLPDARLFDLDFNGSNNVNSSLSGALYRMDLRPGQPVHQWWTHSPGAALPNGLEDVRMVITQDGNVGIGTTTPTAQLDVRAANPSFTTTLYTKNSSPSGGVFSVVNFAGPVGNSALTGDTLIGNEVGNLLISPNSPGKDLQLIGGTWTNPVSMVIKDRGAVGIGTTSPDSLLTVAGVIHSTSGGVEFPDGSVQHSATLIGPQGSTGPTGPQGPIGPRGPQGPAAPVVYSLCTSNSASPAGCSCPHIYSTQQINGGASCTTSQTPGSCTASSSAGCPTCVPKTPQSFGVCCVCSTQ